MSSLPAGALVGVNFNNDGTAPYEAPAALVVVQMIEMDLIVQQRLVVALTSIIASVDPAK